MERKYNEAIVSTSDPESTGEFSSFVSRLALTTASLYGRSIYSDLNIKTNSNGTIMPAHKFVLHARSDKWRNEALATAKELDWSDLDEDIATALLRWIYTDIIDLQHDRLTLGLLKVAHRFSLPGLLGLCERALVASVGVRSCVRFYCVAEEVGAASLLEYCSGIISTHWDDLTAQDFEHMSGPLLYKMLKSKTKYPLHSAVRLLREDVVCLCLAENSNSVSDNKLNVNIESLRNFCDISLAYRLLVYILCISILVTLRQSYLYIPIDSCQNNVQSLDGTRKIVLLDIQNLLPIYRLSYKFNLLTSIQVLPK